MDLVVSCQHISVGIKLKGYIVLVIKKIDNQLLMCLLNVIMCELKITIE